VELFKTYGKDLRAIIRIKATPIVTYVIPFCNILSKAFAKPQ